MLNEGETSSLNGNKDVFTFSKSQHDNIKDTDLLKNLYGNNKETNLYANMESKAKEKDLITESNFTYTTQETKGIKVLRNDLIGVLSPYKTQPITNKETGMQGFITTDEINKISSKKAIDKSVANGFGRDEHFKVAQDLKSLFENSKLKESHADNKQREHIKVHRFIQDLSINDKEAQAKITLFEKIEGKNRIYTLELESLDKPDSLSVSMRNAESAVKAQSVATAHPETTTIAKTDTNLIPQMPKDNSDPLKTFEYFKDDFIKEYPKVLDFHDGHMPMANYLSFYAKENIQAKQQALLNTVKDEFSNILKDIGLKKDEIKQVLDHTNKYDVEHSLSKSKAIFRLCRKEL